jgi:hypothetical protein
MIFLAKKKKKMTNMIKAMEHLTVPIFLHQYKHMVKLNFFSL